MVWEGPNCKQVPSPSLIWYCQCKHGKCKWMKRECITKMWEGKREILHLKHQNKHIPQMQLKKKIEEKHTEVGGN